MKLLLWLLAGCMCLQAAAADRSAEARAVKSARLKQNAAIVAHELDVIASFWTDDVTLCRGLGTQQSGKAAYRQLFADDDPASTGVIIYERIPTAVDVAAQWPLAFETGTWTGRRGSARGPVVLRGRYSAQWVKRASHWLIRSEVFVALEAAGAGLEMPAAP